MPRIPEDLLRSVVYIYPSEQHARENTQYGGTGFVVGMQGVGEGNWTVGSWHYYIVTAGHVVVGKGTRVVRINLDRPPFIETLALEEEDWYWQPGPMGRAKNDLAVCPIDIPSYHSIGIDIAFIDIMRALYREVPAVAPGDDVVMIGRWVDYGGKRRNQPGVRFGSISMMPGDDPIPIDQDYELHGFMVEMRSRGGFSGAPVIVYWDDFQTPPIRIATQQERPTWDSSGVGGLRPEVSYALLGIQHSQFPTPLELYTLGELPKKKPNVQALDWSAMSVVIPSWCLWDLLTDGRLMEMRRKREEERAKPPLRAAEETEEEEALTREGFEATLRKVTRPVADQKQPKRSRGKGKH